MAESEDTSLHFLDYWRVIRSRKEIVITVALLVIITGIAFTFTRPKKYASTVKILVQDDSLDVDVFDRQMVQGYNPFFLRTQEKIIKSNPVLYTVINNLNLTYLWGEEVNEDSKPLPMDKALDRLIGSIRVEQDRDTSIINILVIQDDPEEAAMIANEIADVYKDWRVSAKSKEVRHAIDVLEGQVDKQRQKVDQAELELESIRKELGVNLLDDGLQVDKLRLQQLEADRIGARVEMLVRKARLDQLEALHGTELMNASSFIVFDQTLSDIRQQLVDTEITLKTLLESYGENHPEVKQIAAARNELLQQLNDALDGLKAGLRADYEVAKAKYVAMDQELESAKESDIENQRKRFLPFEKAYQNVQLQRNIYNALVARITQEGIEIEVPRTPVEVIELAEADDRPVSPNLLLNILISIVLGMGAGVGLAYFIEYLDTSVKTVDDIENYLGVPVMGVIPQKVRPLIEEGPGSNHAEAYRVLRTNILFANENKTPGAITVVSGGVGEGKSTTLFNLAYISAQLGDKVLVIDSDLRRPVQHSILGTSNKVGLTNVLMGDLPVEEAIKPTSVNNLHFLPSGRLPRSHLGLLDAKKIKALMAKLKDHYDMIFFDSPPIIGLTDASILVSECDAALLVVQYRKYPKAISLRAKRLIENVGGRVVGVVLNNINIMRDDYYYYYHSNYYPSDNAADDNSEHHVAELAAAGKQTDSF